MDFQYFLILLFVFWILEGLAKAKQRRQGGEEQEEAGGFEQLPPTERREEPRARRPPALPDEAAEPLGRPVPQAPRQPRNLWEEIQEIARQQQEMDRQRRQPQEPPGQRRPQPAPGPVPVEATPSPEEASSERAAAARVEADFGDEDRRSDRWSHGTMREMDPARPAPPVPATPATVAPAPRKDAPARRATHATVASARPRRTSLRERTEVPAHARAAAGPTPRALDPLALPSLSREELRRLLMLQEILGPPVALRDREPGEHD